MTQKSNNTVNKRHSFVHQAESEGLPQSQTSYAWLIVRLGYY